MIGDVSDLTFTVLDTETTAISPRYGNLLEIAAVKVKPVLCIDTQDAFSELINPLSPISYECFRIHGISPDMIKDKPDISQVLPRFVEFSRNTVLAAHNAPFDMGFIKKAMVKYKISPSHIAVLDTVRLARKAFPGFPSYSLDSMIRSLGIEADAVGSYRHRALFDAAHTAALLVKCIKRLRDKGINHIFDL